MFTSLQLELARMRILKVNWKKLQERMFTMQATLMSCRICLMKFWLKLAVSKLSAFKIGPSALLLSMSFVIHFNLLKSQSGQQVPVDREIPPRRRD